MKINKNAQKRTPKKSGLYGSPKGLSFRGWWDCPFQKCSRGGADSSRLHTSVDTQHLIPFPAAPSSGGRGWAGGGLSGRGRGKGRCERPKLGAKVGPKVGKS